MDTLENIEAIAPYKIFVRGEEYYEEGAVKELEETDSGKWEATVCGTDEYNIDIWLEENEIVDWNCDCSYDEGDICKHVIAALFAIRARKKETGKSCSSKESTQKVRWIEIVNSEIIEENSLSNNEWQQTIVSLQQKELSDFVLKYAHINATFKEALLKKFASPKAAKPAKDYRAEVKKCFEICLRSRRYYHQRNDFGQRDWDGVFAKLDQLLDEAALLLKYVDLDATLSITLQTLQSIGEEYDDELVYNDDLYVDIYCERAGDLLLEVIRHPQATQKQKVEILQELRQLVELEPYKDYDVYDLEALMQQVNILAQSPEAALNLIDQLLKERKNSYDLYKLVIQKAEMLQQMNKPEKAEETICKYLHLSEIRKMKVEKLIADSLFDKAIELLDEGIKLSKANEHQAYQVVEWMKLKLLIYEKSNATSAITDMCRQLFIITCGTFDYYQKLKKIVPTEKWPLFLSSMLKETSFRNSFSWGSSVLADIYVTEKDYENLFRLISSATGREQLDGLIKYAHHLKNSYSEVLIALYTSQLLDYAEKNLGRNHYEFIAQALLCMKKLNGGAVAVKHLLLEFRGKYKRRSAMMEILAKS